jgi:hypothetical protein
MWERDRTFDSYRLLPWTLLVVSCALNVWLLLTNERHWPTAPNVPATASCTLTDIKPAEFGPAADILSVGPVQFTGGIRHDENGTLVRTNAEAEAFVGSPHPSIDRAWFELTRGLDLYITPAEADSIDADMHLFDTGMYQIEVEWLHDLHCLNYLRKSFDFEYYTADLHHPAASHIAHRDHCINLLRQVLTCHGDMTPLPKLFDEETGREYTGFDRVHTCRDLGRLRQWATDRSYDAYERRLGDEGARSGAG